MKIGEGKIEPGRVYRYDITGGIEAALAEGPQLYNFISAGYDPGLTGIPLDDDSKGSLKLYAYQQGPIGNPVILNVINYLDGTTQPISGSDGVPLVVFAADGTEPYVIITGPQNPATLKMRLVFYKTSYAPELVKEWDEQWTN